MRSPPDGFGFLEVTAEDNMLGAVRIIMGLAVVGTAVAAGILYRSPWIVALLTLSFTVLYVGGKFSQWRMLARMNGFGAIAQALALTFPIQAFLCGLFYLVGLGIGALFGQRSFAERLDGFDVALAGGLLILGVITTAVIHAGETRAASNPDAALSPEIRAIMDEAFELGQQTVAMPIQIFSLSRRLTDHADRQESLAAMENFFSDESAFVRRIAHTALRFMGQAGRDLDPANLDQRIADGMSDPAVWVRYDAAWAAGEIRGNDAAFAAALKKMIAAAEANGADALPENDSAHKALTRARTSLDAVEQRKR